jgi:hypothetical protein
MNELSLIAAQQWAQQHASRNVDPVEFGANVARAYLAAKTVVHHAGDEKATAAALAALSTPVETLQALAQLVSPPSRPKEGAHPASKPGGQGAVL